MGAAKNQAKENNRICRGDAAPDELSFCLCGNDNPIQAGRIVIGDNCVLESCRLEIRGKNSRIIVGAMCRIMDASLIVAESHTSIPMGDRCLVASGAEIRTGDRHGVCDSRTGVRANRGRRIVSKAFTEGTAAYAGIPATWKKQHVCRDYALDDSRGVLTHSSNEIEN